MKEFVMTEETYKYICDRLNVASVGGVREIIPMNYTTIDYADRFASEVLESEYKIIPTEEFFTKYHSYLSRNSIYDGEQEQVELRKAIREVLR